MRYFKAIAAMSRNGVIGRGSEIPWHIPEDFKWFKRKTMGHILVMGRKTFTSIGKPLPGRETIVLSRNTTRLDGVSIAHDFAEISPTEDKRDVFICGGGEIYAQALPFCDELFLTIVDRDVEGDIRFPEFKDRFEFSETVLSGNGFDVHRYRQRNPESPPCFLRDT
jgi:dihydrofolate reductase